MLYQYYTSLTFLKDFPFLLRKAQFILDGETRKRIREGVSKNGLWGDVQTFIVLNDETFPFPSGIEIQWISVAEQKCFSLVALLDAKHMEELWLRYAQEEPEEEDDDEEDEEENASDDVEVIIETDVRYHLKDANKQQDKKPWRFIRVE